MMVALPDNTGRYQLGAELRRIRQRAGQTVAAAAGALAWSPSKLSRAENAKVNLTGEDLERLLSLYGVGEPERTGLITMAGQSRQRTWWEAHGDALPDAYEAFIGFEADAESIFTYEPQLIPGLLQTDEYASTVMQIFLAPSQPEVITDRMAVRMARQAIVLNRDPPPELCAVIDEAVLRRPVGGTEVMSRQLKRLVEMSGRSTITVQILRFAAGEHRGMHGSFVLLQFPDGSQKPLVYCEGMTGGVLRGQDQDVRMYSTSFQALRSKALDPDESREFIESAIGALGA